MPVQAETPRLSPDGKRLALTVAGDLMIYDLQLGTTIKLTSNAALNRHPAWMPDNKHIIFASDVPSPSGEYAIWWVRADGSSNPEQLFAEKTPLQTFSISPDGHRLAFLREDNELSFVIWLLPLDLSNPDHPRPGKAELFGRESRGQVDPSISPDGRWIAYVTANPSLNGLGGEIMVRQFTSTSPDSRRQVSNGGKFPIWSRNGRELFYLGTDNRIMVVSYTTPGDSFVAEKPRPWSPVPLFRPANASLWNFDLSSDGKHFVILAPAESGGGNVHATVLLNFFDDLRRRMPVLN
jgi:Tol biopolymer transport system component